MTLEAHYRRLLQISQDMLAAGQAQEWETLVKLEDARSSLLEKSPAPVAAKGETPQATVALIHQIQAIDSQLQEIVVTWLEHARILLRIKSVPPL